MPGSNILELLTEAHRMVQRITDMRQRLQFLIRLIEIIEDVLKKQALKKPPPTDHDDDDDNGAVDK